MAFILQRKHLLRSSDSYGQYVAWPCCMKDELDALSSEADSDIPIAAQYLSL